MPPGHRQVRRGAVPLDVLLLCLAGAVGDNQLCQQQVSQAGSGRVRPGQAESGWIRLDQAESGWVRLSQAESGRVSLGQGCLEHRQFSIAPRPSITAVMAALHC
jgi:hypothetical protein